MNNLEKALWGALNQDKYVLGLHWIYDVEKVKEHFRVDQDVFEVLEDSYHKNKKAGDFTHYGDLMLSFMEYMNSVDQIDVISYYDHFRKWMHTYEGYKDKAMKMVLSNIEEGHFQGSDSSELGGLVKLPPILLAYKDKPQLAKLYAIAFTKATHDHPLVVSLATYFSELVFALNDGVNLLEAMEQALASMPTEVVDLYEKAKKALDQEALDAIVEFGQSCPAPNAFPSVIYLLMKYHEQPELMFQMNVKAGGDSAARGILLGMVIGATGYLNTQSLNSMNQKEHIEVMIKQLINNMD